MTKIHRAPQKTFQIKDDIYGQDISVIIGCEDIFKKWLKRNNIRYEESMNYAETGQVDVGTHILYYVRLHQFENTPVEMSTAVHELLHITFLVFENIGFKFDYGNTEPMNYYLEMIYKDFLRKVY